MRPLWSDPKCNGLSSGFSTPAAAIGRRPRRSRWPSRPSNAPGKCNLPTCRNCWTRSTSSRNTQASESRTFTTRCCGNGWTLGSPQLMRVLQATIRLYHRPTVRMMEAHWRQSQPDMVVSFVPHFNRAMGESFCQAFFRLGRSSQFSPTSPTIRRTSGSRSQQQYLICGSDRAVEQARTIGNADDRIFPRVGMILHPRFYDPPVEDRIAERARLGLRPDLPTGLVLFGGHGSKVMLEIAERLDRSTLDLQLIFVCGKNEKLANALRARKSRVPHFVEGFTTARERIHAARGFLHRQARTRQRQRGAGQAPAGDRGVATRGHCRRSATTPRGSWKSRSAWCCTASPESSRP